MKIGIDATCWWNNRGFGRFTRELLTEMFRLGSGHTFVLFVDQPFLDVSRFTNVTVVEVVPSRPTTVAAVADSSRSVFDMYKLYRAVARTPLDIMFFPAVYSWFPVPGNVPTMVTLFDAIAEHYPKLIFHSWTSRLFWTIQVQLAVWRSERILTVTQAAKEEIVEYVGVNPERIDIASAAPNPQFKQTADRNLIMAARQRASLPTDAAVIIYVGGLAPHKNLLGFLDGFEQAVQQGGAANTHLALVGDFKGAGFLSNYEALLARVRASEALRDKVFFTGYASDEDLVALYSSALAVAMPSFSEGFGLPAIEAMACGAPMLSSNRGSLPEVIGDAGIYFDPFDVRAISGAIVKMVQDPELRSQLSANAVEIARGFTWERAARLTLSHLENLHRSRASRS